MATETHSAPYQVSWLINSDSSVIAFYFIADLTQI